MDRILITGANGFIGSHLYSRLNGNHYELRTLSRLPYPLCSDNWVMDLAVDNCPEGLCNGIDTIFHLAGKAHALSENTQDEAEYRLINTEGTRKLLEAAKDAGVKRFIFFSSVKAVGECDLQPMNESVTIPADTSYGQSKYEAEQLVLHGGYVPHPVVIRPCMVYGNSKKGNFPLMITAIHRGLFPPLPELNNRRSMVHVEDVVLAALLMAEKPMAAGQVYIVSDGQSYSTRQLYDWIRAGLGKPNRSWAIPFTILKLMAKIGDSIEWLIRRRFIFDSAALQKLTDSAWYSSAKIERELGFHPQQSLRRSLPDIIRFLNLK